jgi:hypothetical protein
MQGYLSRMRRPVKAKLLHSSLALAYHLLMLSDRSSSGAGQQAQVADRRDRGDFGSYTAVTLKT